MQTKQSLRTAWKPCATTLALLLAISCAPADEEPANNAGSGGSGGSSTGSGGSKAGTSGSSGGSGGSSTSAGSGGSSGGSGGSSAGGSSGSAGSGGSAAGGAQGGEGGGMAGMGGEGGAASPPDAAPPDMAPAVGGFGDPCTEEPAMEPPALRRGKTLGPIPGGQAGQVAAPWGETNILYVIGHRNGNVYAIQNDNVVSTPFASVEVETSGNDGNERGLLSIVFHPDFATNKLFYLFYTGNGARFRVDEFERLTPTTSKFNKNIYNGAGSGRYHNGGSIYFNPKDYPKTWLYHAVGNANSEGNSRTPNGDRGRILRYDVATGQAVPATSGGVGGFTYSYGLRNPYRMSVDRLTGDMWIGDVSGPRGGTIYFSANGRQGNDWGNGNGNLRAGISGNDGSGNAIIGGVVYRGKKIQGLCGRYFFGMNNPGIVKSLIQRNGERVGNVVSHGTLTVPGNLSSFGEDGEGEIWMSSMNNNIYRIEAAQ